MALVRLRVEPLRPTATLQRALSDVPLHPSESRILRQIREAKEGAPLAHVPGSPFGGDVVVKRIDRFGRRRIRGKRGMSKRVIWVKQVAKHFYHNLSTKKLHRTVRTAIRAKQGFAQALYFQLESRLDMFMRRCFFAPSLAAARQAISHKFVLVNGRLAVSASHQLNYGDVVQVDEKAQAKMRRALLVVSPRRAAPRERARARLAPSRPGRMQTTARPAARRARVRAAPGRSHASARERVEERAVAVRSVPAAALLGHAPAAGLGGHVRPVQGRTRARRPNEGRAWRPGRRWPRPRRRRPSRPCASRMSPR